MAEVKAPEMYQFTRENSCHEDVFLGMPRVTVDTTPYMLQDSEGNLFTSLATFDLAKKIQQRHLGHGISTTYENSIRKSNPRTADSLIESSSQRGKITGIPEYSLNATDTDVPS
jgi:hypothetical protein